LRSKKPVKNPVNKKFSVEKNEERQTSNFDHRIIGQQLDLFSIDDNVGIGLPLWHPKGTVVRNIIRDFWEEQHLKNGYQLVCTPHVAREQLWLTSGHLEYYRKNMYVFRKDKERYVVKPMNCPFHVQIYKSRPRSYRDLPIRYAEWGTVYRHERSGTLQGFLRVRGLTQDDAHIFCAPENVETEISRLLDLTEYMMRRFGFSQCKTYLSTRDPEDSEKFMGSENDWLNAQNALAEALRKKKIPYSEMVGEAVFYGPKIDINIVDASGKEWQCTTIQFDFNLPRRFEINYVGSDGKDHQAIMIHRALLGAIERFFAILLEHYGGNLPTWLAPTQVKVLLLSITCMNYAERVQNKLLQLGIRSEIDNSASTISYRIRQAELQKIPFIAVCGKRERVSNKVAVRRHGTGKVSLLTVKELVKEIKNHD
jgi:threonyl-tRNA synthetase